MMTTTTVRTTDGVDLSPVKILATAAAGRPDAVAVVHGDVRWTCADLLDRSLHLAGGLQQQGVQSGDRVVVLARNSPEFLAAYLACSAIGAILVPLSFRLSCSEVRDTLGHCSPRVVIAEPEFATALGDGEPVPAGPTYVVVDGDPAAPFDGPAPRPWIPMSEVLRAPAQVPQPRRADDPALISYTSGSTGRPRGVVVTHGNLWWSWRNSDETSGHALDDVTLVAAPMGHLAALNAFAFRTVVRGGTVVLMRGFDPGESLRLIEEQRVTTMFGVPTMVQRMLDHPGATTRDLSSLRQLLVGGATVPADLLTACASRGLSVMHAWGMTETCGICLFLPPEHALARPTSVGIPVPYATVRLVDPASGAQIVEPGAIGELVVGGPLVSPGYWDDPDLTAATMPDGQMHTGDLALREADGYFRMVGRCKDIIISGGENIYPAEVEAAVRAHPAVRDVVVVGEPDPSWGETVVALVVLEPGRSLDLASLQEFCRDRIARFKAPRRLRVVAEVPLNAVGKPDRRAARELAGSRP